MNAFEQALLKHFGEEKLKKIQSVRVGIAGLGGLGSNCACNLVRSGFRKFVLGDFDKVELSNLNRQFYFLDQVGSLKTKALKENLLRINPDLEIAHFEEKIEVFNALALFSECDSVVEAFDKAEYKKMLVEVFFNSEKLLVSASGLAGWGNSDSLRTKRLKDNFYLIGDNHSAVVPGKPPCAPRVAIAAGKEADVILDWALNRKND